MRPSRPASQLHARRMAVTSWADPVSAEALLDDLDLETARQPGFPAFGMHQYGLGTMYSYAGQAAGRERMSKGETAEETEETERERRRGGEPLRRRLKR